LGDIGSVLAPALVFSVFVLVGNPLIVIFLMRLLGFHTKTGLMAGLTVAQISEFSLLVATMALRGGQISETDLTMLTIVGGITMTVSSYMILHGESFYELVSPLLKRFDPQGSNPTSYSRKHVRRRVVIFGFNRMARALHDIIKSKERKFLVIDNDMDRLNEAEALGATIAFGDLNDVDMLEGLKLEEADLIISTVPARHPNLNLLQYIESTKNKVPVIVSAFDDQDAVDYYQAGADYVLSPYLLIGELLNKIVSKDEPVSYLTRNANRDTKFLSERLASVHGNAQSIELGV
jgi:Trk K+ transport system NAD-binding subunit